MHCEACARKVVKALKGFQGVEEVSADSKGSKVVVKGKEADPMKVVERLQKKSGKKVEFISPLPKPQQEEQGKKEEPPKKEEPLQPPQENKDQDGRVICNSLPKYGNGSEAGNEKGYLVGMTTCYPQPGSIKISSGEVLTLEVDYSKH
ncbi:hypothetical protein HN51_039283 [Arachis hypogaea]